MGNRGIKKLLMIVVVVLFAIEGSTSAVVDQKVPKVIPVDVSLLSIDGETFAVPLDTSTASCNTRYKYAQAACLEELSPHIKTGAAVVAGLLATYNMMKPKEACEKASTAMKAVTAALAAYNTACTATMMMCKSSCGEFVTTSETAVAKLAACPSAALAGVDPASQAKEKGFCAKDATSIQAVMPIGSDMLKTCSSFTFNLVAAGAGLISTLQMLQKSQSCSDLTSAVDCTNPMNSFLPQCQTNKTIDCSLAENASTVTCICQINPLATGCPGAPAAGDSGTPLDGSGKTGGSTSSSLYKTGASLNTGTTYGQGADYSPDMLSGKTDESSNLVKGSAGGSGVSSGGSAGGASSNAKQVGPTGKGGVDMASDGSNLNTNVLAGYEGGGGGGRGGSGSSKKSSSSSLSNYLPGAKQDPNKNKVDTSLSQGISGAGGKTNFQKVNDRYRENRTSLMN